MHPPAPKDFDQTDNENAPKSGVALALGSSFRGYYAHCGFLAELSATGVVPDRVAGSSSGALSALLYAQGLRGDDLTAFILEKGLTRSFFDWGVLYRIPGIVSFTHGTGLFTGNGAIRHLKQRLGDIRIEDLRRPRLEISVTDITNAKTKMITRGDAIEFAIASCAVPGLFKARNVDNAMLWDGGMANDVPFQHWLDDPDIHTIVLHTIRHTDDSLPVFKWQSLGRGLGAGHKIVSDELNSLRKQLAKLRGKRLLECVTIADHPWLSNRKRHTLVESGRSTGRDLAGKLDALGIASTDVAPMTSPERSIATSPREP